MSVGKLGLPGERAMSMSVILGDPVPLIGGEALKFCGDMTGEG